MGFLDMFGSNTPATPTVHTILPEAARQEILAGRLPILRTDTIFLKNGEQCHYVDKAIYEKKVVKKRYVRRNHGMSFKGVIFSDVRHYVGGGNTDVVDNVQYETYRGILYITNKRIIFVSEGNGFDKKIDDLVALTPWANGADFQFSKTSYRLFLPDGAVVNAVLRLIS